MFWTIKYNLQNQNIDSISFNIMNFKKKENDSFSSESQVKHMTISWNIVLFFGHQYDF